MNTSKKLRSAVKYWKRCLESEDTLSIELSPRARKKSCKSPFCYDPFIFPEEEYEKINGVEDERLNRLISRIQTTEKELFYGYPILLYHEDSDNGEGMERIAPLFITKLSIDAESSSSDAMLSVEEPVPEIGINAMNQLGLRSEEVASFTKQILEILFDTGESPNYRVKQVLSLLSSMAHIPIAEDIDPKNLTSKRGFSSRASRALYNKAVFFETESTAFNRALLDDLEELVEKDDLDTTALATITGIDDSIAENSTGKGPTILGFEANEYQLSGIRNALNQNLTVVTGPPGTGKSQFISNLILNLYVQNKKVLLVSHTNEAVEVVHRKIGEALGSILMRTGNKKKRQELEGSFRSLIAQVQERSEGTAVSKEKIEETWESIQEYRKRLIELDKLFAEAERKIGAYRRAAEEIDTAPRIDSVVSQVLKHIHTLNVALKKYKKIQAQMEGKDSFFGNLAARVLPAIWNRRYEVRLDNLITSLPDEFWLLPQQRKNDEPLTDPDTWMPLIERVFKLLEKYEEYDHTRKLIDAGPSKEWIEQEVQQLTQEYIQLSSEYIISTIGARVRSCKSSTGGVLRFLDMVSRRRANEEPPIFYDNIMSMVPVWVSTLKSLRRTFSLHPNIFDYVIFDEASQIDLPSAAPALYRAKRAIVVGDPMQLTHITSLSPQTEKALAEETGIIKEQDMYPSKVCYNAVSLYKASEASLTTFPLLLAQHYRSHEEIIELCNTVFYKGKLSVMTLLDYTNWPSNLETGLHWIDVKGISKKHPVRSRYNSSESEKVLILLKELIHKLENTSFSIGVVTPFSMQRNIINDKIQNHFDEKTIEKHSLKVLTAHQFQGSEKDIMIFSPVVAESGDGNDDRWFDFNPQILNVALSRARRLLYIVGDSQYCAGRDGVLGKIHQQYSKIINTKNLHTESTAGRLDTVYERTLYAALQGRKIILEKFQIVPKHVEGQYTLDIALIGDKRIDIECDGSQHEIVEGIPVISDIRRDRYLKSRGWVVHRIPNFRIEAELDRVIEEVEKIVNS